MLLHRVVNVQGEPRKIITQEDGQSLYREELFSTYCFSGIFSNKYHIHMPTQVLKIRELNWKSAPIWSEAPLQHYHFVTDKKKTPGNFDTARNEFLKNRHCIMSTANVTENDSEMFFRNTGAHEYLFVH